MMARDARREERRAKIESEQGIPVSISDDRYLQDLRRYNLALTLLHLAARPNTVQAWTGFSRQRVRQVIRHYRKHRSSSDPRCDRGPSPKRLAKLMNNPTLRSELTAMAGLCRLLHLIPEERVSNARATLPHVDMAERLCHALAIYRRMVPHGRLTFEQLIVLVFALAEGNDWALERCVSCRAVFLIDPLSIARRICSDCRDASIHLPCAAHGHATDETVTAKEDEVGAEGVQQSLF
jgi:hypothetical protein